MKSANELYKAQKAIIDDCKENICRELERIGRTELWFDDPFPVLVDNNSCSYGYDSGATAETIASISINESGQYKRLYAVLSNSLAEGMGYTQTELHNLKKSLKHPVLCVPR